MMPLALIRAALNSGTPTPPQNAGPNYAGMGNAMLQGETPGIPGMDPSQGPEGQMSALYALLHHLGLGAQDPSAPVTPPAGSPNSAPGHSAENGPSPYALMMHRGFDMMNRGDQTVANAYGNRPPDPVHPAFRSRDLLMGLLPAILLGMADKHGRADAAGQFVAQYAAGKQREADERTQLGAADFARKLQAAQAAAQGQTNQGQRMVEEGRYGVQDEQFNKKLASEAEINKANNDRYFGVAGINNRGKSDVQDKKAQQDLWDQVLGKGGKTLADDRVRAINRLEAMDVVVPQPVKDTASQPTEYERSLAAQTGQRTSAGNLSDANAALAGKTGQLTDAKTQGQNLENQYLSKTMQARIALSKRNVDAVAARIGLTKQSAALLGKQVANYDAEFQGKALLRKAQVAKLERDALTGADPLKNAQQQRLAYEGVIGVNKAQIDSLLKRYKSNPPVYDENDPESQESNDAHQLQLLEAERNTLKKKVSTLATGAANSAPGQGTNRQAGGSSIRYSGGHDPAAPISVGGHNTTIADVVSSYNRLVGAGKLTKDQAVAAMNKLGITGQ